jgi:hypothetical protein
VANNERKEEREKRKPSSSVHEMKQKNDKTAQESGISLPKWKLYEVRGEKYHEQTFIKPARRPN